MSDYDLLQFHAFCLTDTGTRLSQYARAISSRVQDGDVVLDLGTGSGLLAFLACRAGARRVYAVETSEAIRFGEHLASLAGFADRIEFIQAPSSQLVLPEQVDAIVGDIHDTFGLQTSGLAAFFDARDRLLKPSGALIPRAIQLLAAPVDAPELYARAIDVWIERVQDVDLSPLRPFAVNQMHAARFDAENLLAPPGELAVIDLERSSDLHAGGTVTTAVRRHGTLHGVCGCFVTTLGEAIVMSNVPGDNATTNFAQAFFPLSAPVPVSAGDLISIGVDTYDGHVTRWRVDVARPGEPLHARFEHSTFGALPLSVNTLRRSADDYRPLLTHRGAMERALLDRFDGASSAKDLEAWLRERFGELLPSEREAAAFLKAAIERCG